MIEKHAPRVFRSFFHGKKTGRGSLLSSPFRLSRNATRVKAAPRCRADRDRDELTDGYALVYRRLCRCTTFVGAAAINRPRKTPLFDYSSTVAKEKPQVQGPSRNDFRA